MKIYLASPFFNEEERKNLSRTEQILRKKGHTVFSPREHEAREVPFTSAWSLDTFQNDRRFIDWADAVVMLYYGGYSDSGTAWECGYAYATHKPVIVVHYAEQSNLMVHEGCHTNLMPEELEDYDFESMPTKKWTGNMI